jgi:hypothetical protein
MDGSPYILTCILSYNIGMTLPGPLSEVAYKHCLAVVHNIGNLIFKFFIEATLVQNLQLKDSSVARGETRGDERGWVSFILALQFKNSFSISPIARSIHQRDCSPLSLSLL